MSANATADKVKAGLMALHEGAGGGHGLRRLPVQGDDFCITRLCRDALERILLLEALMAEEGGGGA